MSSQFRAALEDRDLEGLRSCAKADLHVHAGFTSGDREFLTAATGLDIAPLKRALASMDDMHAWVQSQAEAISTGCQGACSASRRLSCKLGATG
jgi:hypothetical protein